MRRRIFWLILFVGAFTGLEVYASCTKDIDCEGMLVCVSGVCKAGAAETTESAPADSSKTQAEATEEDSKDEADTDTEPKTSEDAEAAETTESSGEADGCSKDTDCKGNRVCEQNVCVEPRSAAPVTPERPLSDGWALGGAIMGLVIVAPVTGLGIASALTNDNTVPSVPLGGSATVLTAIVSPLVFGSGRSARRGAMVRGVVGLTVTGWVTYGLCLGNAIVMIALGLSDVFVPSWEIVLATVMADVSLISFSIDALVSHKRAKRAIEAQEGNVGKGDSFVALSPAIAPVKSESGVTGGVLGLVGTF